MGNVQLTAAFRTPQRSSLLQILKSAVAIGAAWFAAAWLIQGPLPVFAAIAALLVVQPSLNQSFAKAIERSVGVMLGVVIAAAFGLLFGDATWVILVATTVGLVVAWAVRMTPGGTNQVAISAILVLALGTTTPGYALDRVLETLLGALIGFVVNVVLVPPVAIAPARDAMDALVSELAASFDRLADALETPQNPQTLEGVMLEARLLRPMREKADEALHTAEDSLALNPRGKRHRAELSRLRSALEVYSPVITQLIGMTRTVYDGYGADLSDDPNVRAIAEQLRRAAHDVGQGYGTPQPATEPPALTAPLHISSPSPEHWILIGSLLEDLHRVHRALRGDDAQRP